VLSRTWRQGIDLAADAAVWRMIEAVAAAVEQRQLDKIEIAQISAGIWGHPIT
jgi:hypothetical protein